MDKNRKATLDRRAKGRERSNAKKGKYMPESAVETSESKKAPLKTGDADSKAESSPTKA